MKTAILLTCAMALFAFGTSPVVAADPPETKVYWYDVVVSLGQSTETITGASDMEPGAFAECMAGTAPVYLEQLRIQGLKLGDDTVKWHPREGRTSVYIQPRSVVVIYELSGDPVKLNNK